MTMEYDHSKTVLALSMTKVNCIEMSNKTFPIQHIIAYVCYNLQSHLQST